MPGKEPLALAYQQLLQDQVIDERGPGTVLRDVETILNFIGSDGVAVSAKTSHLPPKTLVALNAKLTQPVEIDLKRRLQKSYPNIHGLYLVLRASGLCVVVGSGSRSRLLVEGGALDSWKALNPTERYFSLLEAWMVRGNPEILSESTPMQGAWIPECQRLFELIPRKGSRFGGNDRVEGYIPYSIGLYGLSLLYSFGLITLESLKPEKGRGWRIAGIARTGFGDALLQLLGNAFWADLGSMHFLGKKGREIDDTIGALRPGIAPFFPGWRRDLSIPKPVFKNGTHVFKVSLSGKCWRRIEMSAGMNLHHLSTAILDAFEFDYDHLYAFTYRNRFGALTQACHPNMDDSPHADEVRIGDLPLQTGSAMTYNYDFGDDWRFSVKLEHIDPDGGKTDRPRVSESRGEAPEQYGSWEE
jgi:hypothetical protein